jgi:O-antigen/teichoic acid export membrane protein
MMMHKIGGVLVSSTDNIILSSFVSLDAVGLYSNYFLITNAINSVTQHVFNSLTASVGNMFVLDNKEKQYSIFKDVLFLDFWLYCFISVSLLCLLNPFIELWIGSDYLFSFDIVCIIVINVYVLGMRKSIYTFREASGLFYKDRWKSIFEAIVNLVSSIILAIYFGTFGVFLGTLISYVTVCSYVEPYILYKYGFGVKLREYFVKYFMYLIITVASCALTYYLCSFIVFGRFVSLLLKGLLCLIVPNLIVVICYRKTSEYQYLKRLIKSFLNRFRKRKEG